MYLKSLELVGFKSFATRTVLEFHSGVTAIVGPNGCGKSNVLDAIKWVLGEQSAKALRGGEMADVIFNGTDTRPQMGMAEVSMTFADCEKELGVQWNEVTITRRVHRDGKGEYFINRTPCRLRDIQELFMDTGIGRSAYSIMEQGKIDQILSSKPEERRAIFEEAAGITKFKAQKKEAMRKLEHTEANLLRVADVIAEVKRQMGSLQRQAAKARRYQNLSQTVRVLDTHLTAREFALLERERGELQGRLEELTGSHEAEGEAIERGEGELISLRAQLGTLDESIGALRDECQALNQKVYSAQSRLEAHGQRIEELEATIARCHSDIASARAKSEEQEHRISETDAALEALRASIQAAEAALAAKEQEVCAVSAARARAEEELSAAAAEASRFEGAQARLHSELSALLGRTEAAESRLGQLEAETAAAYQAAVETEKRRDEASQRASALRARGSEVEERIVALQGGVQEMRKRLQAAEGAQRRAERAASELRSKVGVLRELEASGEGLGEGTQAVLKGLGQPELILPGLAGTLASQVTVAPEHAAVIEALLGQRLSAVLVKDALVAEAAAAELACGDFGRAWLLLLPWVSLKGGEEPGGVREVPEGALAWAADLIQAAPEIKRFTDALLRDAVVVGGLSEAFALRAKAPDLVVATLGGEVVTPEGLLGAGKCGRGASSALLRKHEIAELQGRLDAAEAELATAAEEWERLRQGLEEAEQSLEEAREERQTLQSELSGVEKEAALLGRQVEEMHARHSYLEGELHSAREAIGQSRGRVAELEAELLRMAEKLSEMHSRRAAAEAHLASCRAQEAVENENLNQLRLRAASARGQLESMMQQLEPMQARLSELAELIELRESEASRAGARIAELEDERIRLEETIAESGRRLREKEQQGGELLEERSALTSAIKACEERLRQSRLKLTHVNEEKGRIEVQLTQLGLRQEHLAEHLRRRYQIEARDFEPDFYALQKTLKEVCGGGRHKEGATVSGVPAREEGAPEAEERGVVAEGVGGEADATGGVVSLAEGRDESGDTEAPGVSSGPGGDVIAWEEVRRLVKELSERLDGMGPVNLEAIQEFEELEERHRFLEQQSRDLINSKNELNEVIARINKTTREMFSETFEKIRGNFQAMFTELFGGGKANLLLQDDGDPLESGIEIIAKPPGKQPQSVSLLSGGERTMTAVALLFAIYMVKPSPFCVLDEMDAPLDESNINRFIKILDRFTAQSQFMVITHNKRTISRADVLYGVTMEEQGVSKLVSMRFSGLPEEGGKAAPTSSKAGEKEKVGQDGETEAPELNETTALRNRDGGQDPEGLNFSANADEPALQGPMSQTN